MFSVRAALRDTTRQDHARVDDAFAAFDLHDPQAYAAFLRAHAAVLPQAEAVVAQSGLWSEWTPRTPALLADLDGLATPPPAQLSTPLPTEPAGQWGLLYVLEGARLGGAVLAGRVSATLPRRYLSDRAAPGSWTRFQALLDHAAPAEVDDWLARCIQGAKLTFSAFERAASEFRVAVPAAKPAL